MICALGLGDQLVGVTHECDYPPFVRNKPQVVHNALPIETMSEREIDEAVSARLRSGFGLYVLDMELIERLKPDIIVTQDLCEVCAPSEMRLRSCSTSELQATYSLPDAAWSLKCSTISTSSAGRPAAKSRRGR